MRLLKRAAPSDAAPTGHHGAWFDRVAPWIAAGLTAAVVLAGHHFGLNEAGGADAYGYVSEAVLFTNGHLHVHQPIAATAPWPNAAATFTPLGYVPVQGAPERIAPVYSPGLPLVMAGLALIGGMSAVFWAVPMLGGLAVWSIFIMGRRIGGAMTGLLAAFFLAVSPTFLTHLIAPISDVAGTGWWMAAVALAGCGTLAGVAGSGAAASAAILTRPNLAPLALVLGGAAALWAGTSWRRRMAAAGTFVLALLPGCVGLAWFYDRVYGSPLTSGYGRLNEIYYAESVFGNLMKYPAGLAWTHSPFIFFGLAASLFVYRTNSSPPRRPSSQSFVWFGWIWVVTLLALYVPYVPYRVWQFTRYMLPAIPILLVSSCFAGMMLMRRLSNRSRLMIALPIVLLVTARCLQVAADAQVFRPKVQGFEQSAAFARKVLPPNAIVFAYQQSGSLRLYADLMTIQWIHFPPEWFDRGLEFLRAQGYVPYLMLEEWEEPIFRDRFAGKTDVASLDWPPLAVNEYLRVRIYDPRDRLQISRSDANRRGDRRR